MQSVTRYALAVVFGLVGAGLFYLVLLAYQDHQLLNAIRANAQQQQAQDAAQVRQFQARQQQVTQAPTPAK